MSPSNLHHRSTSLVITIQSPRSTRSSSLITLLHLPSQSRLKITNRSFRHAAPQLWNKLPHSLRAPYVPHCFPLSSCSNPSPVVNLLYHMASSIYGSKPTFSSVLLSLSLSLFWTDLTVIVTTGGGSDAQSSYDWCS